MPERRVTLCEDCYGSEFTTDRATIDGTQAVEQFRRRHHPAAGWDYEDHDVKAPAPHVCDACERSGDAKHYEVVLLWP